MAPKCPPGHIVEVSKLDCLLDGLYCEVPSQDSLPNRVYRLLRSENPVTWGQAFLCFRASLTDVAKCALAAADGRQARTWIITEEPYDDSPELAILWVPAADSESHAAFAARACDTGTDAAAAGIGGGTAAATAAASAAEGPPLEGRWLARPSGLTDAWKDRQAVSCRPVDLKEVSSRRDTKSAISKLTQEPRRYTRFRISYKSCPSVKCHDDGAGTEWGFPSEVRLYAHLCFFHRVAPQYYELSMKYYSQAVAEELDSRGESPDDILQKFTMDLERHNVPVPNRGPHRNRIQTVVERLGITLTRGAAETVVLEDIEGWPEDQRSQRHYSNSWRWFRKWVEVSVVAEVILEGRELTEQQAPPVIPSWHRVSGGSSVAASFAGASPSVFVDVEDEPPPGCTSFAQSSSATLSAPLARAAGTSGAISRGNVAAPPSTPSPRLSGGEPPPTKKAKRVPPKFVEDPFLAVCSLPQGVPKARPPGSAGCGGGGGGRRAPDTESDFRNVAWSLYRVSQQCPEAAEQVTDWEERSGPCTALIAAARQNARHSVLNDLISELTKEQLEHAWLWCYCGLGPRTQLLKALAAHRMRDEHGHVHAYREVLKRLLCAAASPSLTASAVDVADATDFLLLGRLPEVRLNLRGLTALAKRCFVTDPKMAGVAFGSRTQQDADGPAVTTCMYGSLLGNLLAREPSFVDQKSLPGICVHLDYLQSETATPWFLRAALGCGLCWTADVKTAYGRLTSVRCLAKFREDWKNLQDHGLTQAQSTGLLTAAETAAARAWREARPCGSSSSSNSSTATTSAGSTASSAKSAPVPLTPAAAAVPSQVTTPSPAAPALSEHTPSRLLVSGAAEQRQGRSIKELNDTGTGDTLEAFIVYRRELTASTGPGLSLLVSDDSGKIQIKFWSAAAVQQMQHSALHPGAKVRFQGFDLKDMSEQEARFAPPGRQRLLQYQQADRVRLTVLRDPPASLGASTAVQHVELVHLREASVYASGYRVTLPATYVAEVEDLQEHKTSKSRSVWLSEGPEDASERLRWVLWNSFAEKYGKKQLQDRWVIIRGALLKDFLGRRELSGCYFSDGVAFLGG